jgi:putative peptide zinc metalloprotease protein
MTDPISVDPAERPLAIRKRPDLIARAHRPGGRRIWRVKDPLSLEYFEFSDQEFAILGMLDGSTSAEEIQRRFEREFSPLQLGRGQLQNYLHSLQSSGLVVASGPGQGVGLLERRRERSRRETTSRVVSLLAFRLRGIDPQPLLDWLGSRLSWIFSLWFLTACGILIAAAATLAAVQFPIIQARTPTWGEFLTPGNAVWLCLILASAKVLHELAHGLTCRHFGGECHELGLMFLMFTPCLYCNVSDSWMLPGRRERILISGAGVAVELVLAASCTFLWWFSQPGLFNSICLNVMLVCSVSTLAFNANPLLRYDGYFILADLLQESNLSQKSGTLLRQALRDWFCGIPWSDQSWRTMERPWRLAVYGVLSSCYRLFVLSMILWISYSFFKAQHLQFVGWTVVCLGLFGALAGPVAGTASFLMDPTGRRRLDRARIGRLGVVLAGLFLAAVFIPLPRWVPAEVVLEAPSAARVYVPVAGRVLEALPAGTRVQRDDIVARLASPQLQRDLEKTVGERNQAQLHLEQLEASRTEDPSVSAQIPTAREAFLGLERRLEQQRRDEERLILRAPADGVVLPPPSRTLSEIKRPELSGWRGSPLDAINSGCWLEMGTLFCQVGNPADVGPALLINQADVDLVQTRQRVRIRVDEWPSSVLTGTISEVAAGNLQIVPRELATAGELAARRDAAGVVRPAEATYTARVVLDDHPQLLLLRGRGRAKIAVVPIPLAQRLYRAVRQTFHFRM